MGAMYAENVSSIMCLYYALSINGRCCIVPLKHKSFHFHSADDVLKNPAGDPTETSQVTDEM